MTIVAGIAAIWALCLLSLVFTLPHEFVSPAGPDDDAIREPSKQ